VVHYSRDARYFGRSFRKILKDSLQKAGLKKNITEIRLSSGLEKIEIIYSDFNPDKKNFEHILLISGNLIAEYQNNFNKEIYVEGNASFGRNNIIRAAAVNKDAEISGNAKIIRWLDVNGGIKTGEEIDLGMSASCGGKFQLSKGCKFRRLFGNPILTFKDASPVNHGLIMESEKNMNINKPTVSTYFNEIIDKYMKYDEPAIINGDLIINGNLEIKNEFTINGSIKASGKITIKTIKSVNIVGNIISENIIAMAGNIKVYGVYCII
jgi:hypothetical protein